MQDKKIIIISLVLIVLLAGAYYLTSSGLLGLASAKQLEAVRVKAEKFINENLVASGTTASVKNITEEGGVYKIYVSIGSQEIISYLSKDGKNFFPEAYSMDTQSPAASVAPASQEVSKTEKPAVELFVMSYCPYGLQAEKGILPAVKLLGSKIDFQLKFVNYAMHGDKEIAENLRQYAIQQNAPDKLNSYLECFAKQGDYASCVKEAKIDSAALASWVKKVDAQFQITAKAADKTQWEGSFPPFNVNKDDNVKYNVQGSPTLVINGATLSSARDPQSFLKTICSAFNDAPAECQQKLSMSALAAGFGEGTGNNASAQCGN